MGSAPGLFSLVQGVKAGVSPAMQAKLHDTAAKATAAAASLQAGPPTRNSPMCERSNKPAPRRVAWFRTLLRRWLQWLPRRPRRVCLLHPWPRRAFPVCSLLPSPVETLVAR